MSFSANNNDGAGFGLKGENATPPSLGNREPGVVGTSQGSVGVFGTSGDISSIGGSLTIFGNIDIGVEGASAGGTGVRGVTGSGTGVRGVSVSGTGVRGDSTSGPGVFGLSAGLDGVHGESQQNGASGVFGLHTGSKGRGVQGTGSEAGVGGFSETGSGVLAQSKTGIAILAQGPTAGRFEGDVEVTGALFAHSDSGDGVNGETKAPGRSGVTAFHQGGGRGLTAVGSPAGHFDGDVEVTRNLSVDGDVRVSGDVFLPNRGDLAEQFEVNSTAEYRPGMLMVIGENGALEPCSSAYDKRAIGVISGAGALRPAITLGSARSRSATAPIALVGTAFCLVDADLEPIEAGDLLASSPTIGHAMRAKDPMKSLGAIVGKALAFLHEGRGLVPMVISLQ